MYYFYCPNCKKEYNIEQIPRNTIPNIRDGYGVPINHYECSNCHNLDAGFMKIRNGENVEDIKEYYRSVIEMYQGIRGFNQ